MKKTVLYEARNALRTEGRLVLEDGYLSIPDERSKEAWTVLADVTRRWQYLNAPGIGSRDKLTFATSLGPAVSKVASLPCSPGLIRRLRRDLPGLPREVFVALLPFLQQYLRSALQEAARPQGRTAGSSSTRLRSSSWAELEAAILSPLRRVMSTPPSNIEELTLCANLLFELLSRNRLPPEEIRLAVEWALARLSTAESFDDYVRRWETLRALIREGGHNFAVRRMLEIEASRASKREAQAKPWLSDLPERLFQL